MFTLVKRYVYEAVPGVVLVVTGLLLPRVGGFGVSPLPVLTSFTLFFTASVVSGSTLRRLLVKFYSWRYFDVTSPLLFLVPLFLVLHTGYEYAYANAGSIVELATSMLTGIGLFLVTHPVLRVV